MKNPGKYKHLIIGILLLAYLTAAFQKPVFEMLHLLSHCQELFQKDYEHHHFHSHSGDHVHTKLAHLNIVMSIHDSSEASDNQQFTTLEQIKLPELTNTYSFPTFSFLKPLSLPFQYSLIFDSAFITVNFPPPKARLA